MTIATNELCHIRYLISFIFPFIIVFIAVLLSLISSVVTSLVLCSIRLVSIILLRGHIFITSNRIPSFRRRFNKILFVCSFFFKSLYCRCDSFPYFLSIFIVSMLSNFLCSGAYYMCKKNHKIRHL